MTLLLVVVALPFGGAATLAILGRRIGRGVAGAILVGSLVIAFGAALAIAQAFGAGKTSLVADLGPWLPLRGADLVLRAEPATVPLLVAFAGIAAFVALFAVATEDREDDPARLGAAFALTAGATSLVVVASNLMLLFAGWELAAVGTYLLVGYRRDLPAAAAAAVRSFVVVRVGDAALLVAILALFGMFHTADIAEIAQRVGGFSGQPDAAARIGTVLLAPSLLVLVAALARSAQLPFHFWLPEVALAPTAASALIHTAVAAGGVVLLVRLAPSLHPSTLAAAAAVGAITAVVGAVVALAQTDQRRLLAWSTVSQVGLIFVGAGSGAVFAALFALLAHALGKAALILAVGVRRTRLGAIAFATGVFAVAAVPPTAGYFGAAALAASVADRPVLLAIVLATIVVTGLYGGRLLFLAPPTAEGSAEPRSPFAILPPVVLALAALSSGALVASGAISLGLASRAAPPDLALSCALLALVGVAGGVAIVVRPPRLRLPAWLDAAARSGSRVDTLYRLSIVELLAATAHVLDRGTEHVVQASSAFVGAAVTRTARVTHEAHRRYARASEAIVLAAAAALVAYWTFR